jgi:ADP-heptose:LPS heptosyltransferase
MDRILIIKLSAFGDVVQAEGAIHDISNQHPDAEIMVMTTPPFRELMQKCPWVDSVFIDRRESRWRLDKMAGLRSRLRKLAVKMVYDLQQVSRTAFYHRFLLNGVPWLGGGNTWLHSNRELENKSMMDRFAVQLTAAGIRVQHTLKPELSWMAEDVTALLAAKNVTRPYIVFIPGSSAVHDDKRWPYYNELAARLRREGKDIVTVPGPDELELCRSLTQAKMLTEGDPYLTVFELAGVLKQAEFVVGNDTGPTHLAAHLGRPGLALFSSSHFQPTRTGIQHSRFSYAEADAVRDLSLATVQEKVLSLLKGD